MNSKLFPLVSSDVALFSLGDGRLEVLVARRAQKPLEGLWALPGAVLKPDLDRSLEDTARRALRDKLGVEVPYLQQLSVFDGEMRDPRGWSISVLHCALVSRDSVQASARLKVDDVRWVDADAVGKLAFDHREQVAAARDELRRRVRDQALPLHLLPEKFTLTQLQRVCELILREGADDPLELDKGAFRRRLARSADFEPVEGEFERGPQRPAQLYRAVAGYRFEPRTRC